MLLKSVLRNTQVKNKHGYIAYRKEVNVLFNDALNTFYLRLFGVGKGPLR